MISLKSKHINVPVHMGEQNDTNVFFWYLVNLFYILQMLRVCVC